MSRNTVTARYLDAVAEGRPPVDELMKAAQTVDLSQTMYATGYLFRPVFLSRAEVQRLAADLRRVHAALAYLPDRLFGGDIGAFARAVGARGPQVDAALRAHTGQVTRLSRADIYADATGFRLLELNVSAALGGLDNAALNRALLAHPGFAEFVEANDLSYVDTLAEVADTLRDECGIPDGRPVVAVVDWPDSFPRLERLLRYNAARLAGFGIDAVPCHLGQLSVRDGRVWIGDRPVDVVYRLFLLEALLRPGGAELITPVLRAAERGEVKLFTPIGSELYGSKGALALLSDEANRSQYTADELETFDRFLPWTRMVRPGPVTVDGESVDLAEYARDQRENLVLKATMLHGGNGFVGGWLLEPAEWDRRVAEAMDGPYILQRRIRPVPELFPADHGSPRPWILTWGVFQSARGYAGAYLRASEDAAAGVVALASGALATCCFHER
jgi:hypothetical protein